MKKNIKNLIRKKNYSSSLGYGRLNGLKLAMMPLGLILDKILIRTGEIIILYLKG
jgi:hypothetical protein